MLVDVAQYKADVDFVRSSVTPDGRAKPVVLLTPDGPRYTVEPDVFDTNRPADDVVTAAKTCTVPAVVQVTCAAAGVPPAKA